jgi:hypothetical protein
VVEPFIIEGLFGPDGGLDKKFKLVMAGLADVPVGYMKVISAANGLLNGLSTHIAG